MLLTISNIACCIRFYIPIFVSRRAIYNDIVMSIDNLIYVKWLSVYLILSKHTHIVLPIILCYIYLYNTFDSLKIAYHTESEEHFIAIMVMIPFTYSIVMLQHKLDPINFMSVVRSQKIHGADKYCQSLSLMSFNMALILNPIMHWLF